METGTPTAKKNRLTMYRRHVKSCDKTKPTYFPSTARERKLDDCECPISITGYLRYHPKRILHYSLGTSDWIAASEDVAVILKAGRLPEEVAAAVETKPKENVKVVHAITAYLERCATGSDKVSDGTYSDYKIFLKKRMLPWCEKNRIVNLKELEVLETMRKFDQSWVNMLHPERPLNPVTRKKFILTLRTFFNWCIENEWMVRNTAKLIGKGKAAAASEDEDDGTDGLKVGLELEEYERVMKTLDSYPKTLDTQRLRAIIELQRWSGLRISDATKFCRSELVRNDRDTGWNASFVAKKTKKRCVSPVPDHVAEMLLTIPYIAEDGNGKKYWFKIGHVAPEKFWYRAIIQLFADAQEKYGKFAHKATPHILRHTFAIQLLNNGVDIRAVSKWLGHYSVKITEEHYSNENKASIQNREDASRMAFERMQERIKAMSVVPANVVPMVRKQA